MRFFIALEIPEQSRRQLQAVQQKLKELTPGVRLTNPDKLHLTLAFIGEEPDKIRDQLVEAMKNATWEIPPFQVTPAYFDAFPALRNPHTFWVGVNGDIDKLIAVKRRLRDELIRLGLDTDDRRYIPHIAIGKIGDFKPLPFHLSQFEKMMAEENFQPIKIKCIKLFESIPEEGFHRHNTLAEVPLIPTSA